MRVVVMGTGYVGLVAGACFSDSGNHVTSLDVDKDKVSSLQAGRIPIFEPGLDEMVSRNSKAGRLTFSTDFEGSLKNASVIFIAVGTPSESDGRANLSYVFKAADMILTQRLKVQGFIVSEHMEIWPEALTELGTLVATGKLKPRESIAQGLAAAPEAFLGLLKGKNFGKQLVKLL